jgi:hypothetical protein
LHTQQQVEALQSGQVSDEEVATVLRIEALSYQESQQENSYWHETAAQAYLVRLHYITLGVGLQPVAAQH